MTTIYTTAGDAITASVLHNEITRCERTADNLANLAALCDDSVEADEIEFWGTDDDGDEWRVHVAAA